MMVCRLCCRWLRDTTKRRGYHHGTPDHGVWSVPEERMDVALTACPDNLTRSERTAVGLSPSIPPYYTLSSAAKHRHVGCLACRRLHNLPRHQGKPRGDSSTDSISAWRAYRYGSDCCPTALTKGWKEKLQICLCPLFGDYTPGQRLEETLLPGNVLRPRWCLVRMTNQRPCTDL